MSWLSCTLQLSTKLSVEKACDQPVKRRIWAFGRSEVTQNSHSQSPIKTHGQIFGKFCNNLPSTLRFIVELGSEEKMRLVPLLVWHLYDPALFSKTELMVRLFPDTVMGLPSLYHRNSHPVETFMWQRNETESSVCIRVWSGDWISWTLGFVSVESSIYVNVTKT